MALPLATKVAAACLVVFVIVALSACGDDPSAETPTSTPPIATNTSVAPTLAPITPSGDLGIQITAPGNGATLGRTFQVEVAVSGATLALGPAGELVPGGAHWHLFINGELQPNAYGLPVANVGPLDAGDYKLTAALYLNDMDQTYVAVNQVEATVEQ